MEIGNWFKWIEHTRCVPEKSVLYCAVLVSYPKDLNRKIDPSSSVISGNP